MRSIVIGKYSIRLWVLLIVLSGLCIATFAAYFALTFVIPLEVKEPLEVVSYPSSLSLYPGDNVSFNVTLRNNAAQNYTVYLVFTLTNTTYQDSYVAFSNETYVITPGTHSLQASLNVTYDAPPANVDISVKVERLGSGETGFMGSSSITITDASFQGTSGAAANYINVTLKNTGTKTVTIGQIKINNVIKTFTATGSNYTLPAGDINHIIKIQNVGWINGNPYKIDLYDTSGSAVGSTQYNSPGS